ncbi:hypothetical protein [Roseobacter weihaiensis]|uniref:hypothetical protein n=1 Tax=Roseobacter weihaiensis TaxID=2763262 RepID=UPI001D0B0337|nr:hypothetical protein [Roseobacter sp. H9]
MKNVAGGGRAVERDATLRFFVALGKVSTRLAGAESGIARADANTVADPQPAKFVAAQDELAGLDDDLRDQILHEVHQQMSRDVSAIWDNMMAAKPVGRPN